MAPSLSARGAGLLNFPRPSFASAHYDSIGNTYDPETNSSGLVNLSLAENRLGAPLVAAALSKVGACAGLDSMQYNPYHGSLELRSALSRVIGRHVAPGVEVDPAGMVAVNGAGSALLLLATVLADPGDVALLPTPYYYAYDRDLRALAGVTVAPVGRMGDRSQLTPASLSKASARAGGCRLLVVTTPDNPSGAVAEEEEIRGAVRWAADNGVHVVINELYGCSVHRGSFRSVLGMWPKLPPNVHFIWGLSKDFGASGLRSACIVSGSQEVTAACTKYAYFFQTSATAQRQIAAVLSNDSWVDWYITENRRLLLEAVEETEAAVAKAGIPFEPSKGGLFVWIDLSRWVRAMGGELPLFDLLRRRAGGGVLLCPGGSFGADGWFRICVTAAPSEHLREGIRRLVEGLREVPAAKL